MSLKKQANYRFVVGCAMAVAGLLMPSLACRAQVRLAPVFGDGMVLQRNARVPVWGQAAPGEQVEVHLPRQRQVANADDQGRWQVQLDPLQPGMPFEMEVVGKDSRQSLRDVVVGDVWLCSGQSNMQLEVRIADHSTLDVARVGDAQFRVFTVRRGQASKTVSVFGGQWSRVSPQNVLDMAAVPYYFGQQLRQKLDVPIGLIISTVGGSTAQSWIPPDALRASPQYASMLAEDWTAWTATHDEYDIKMEAWLKERLEAKQAGKPEPARPVWPPIPFRWNRPAFLYERMVAPIVPYALRGVIWYQGEANATRAASYRTLFPTLIRGWRAQWKQENLPFLWVQLPNFKAAQPQPAQSEWAELREAQAITLSVQHSGMAVTIDIGDAADIHPRNKAEVGRRLALVAFEKVYGLPVESSGPVFESMSIRDSRVVLQWKHATGLKTTDGEAPHAFAVSGQGGVWHWAQAAIEGETVVLQSPQVPHPVEVRYGWADNPPVNLVNAQGLPAMPFRTDKSPGTTQQQVGRPADQP